MIRILTKWDKAILDIALLSSDKSISDKDIRRMLNKAIKHRDLKHNQLVNQPSSPDWDE